MAESPFQNGVSVDELVSLLEQHRKYITEKHLLALARLVRSFSNNNEDSDSTDIENVSDLRTEIQELVRYLRKVRDDLTSREGVASAREIKDLIQSATSLYTMLTKLDNDITNQARLRCIEAATLEAIKTLSPADQSVFFTTLEEKLSE